MQYILIETEGTLATREVQVLTTQSVAALSTSQLGGMQTSQIEALTLTQIEQYRIPGMQLYQCIHMDGAVDYRDLAGTVTTFTGGSGVVDADPPVPAWDVPEVPTVVATAPTERVITKLDYMNRFQDAELAALYTAAKSVVQIEVWLEKFKVSEFIDLSDPRTAGGLYALEAAGLIGPGRAAEILT